MFKIFKIQQIRAVIEHVNHFMSQYTLHDLFRCNRILTNDNLIHFGIISSRYTLLTLLAWDMTSDIQRTVEFKKYVFLSVCRNRLIFLRNSFSNFLISLPSSRIKCFQHNSNQRVALNAFDNIFFTFYSLLVLATWHNLGKNFAETYTNTD